MNAKCRQVEILPDVYAVQKGWSGINECWFSASIASALHYNLRSCSRHQKSMASEVPPSFIL